MNIFPQIVVNGIIAGSVGALVALGLSLMYGVLKFMNFAHGEMAMLGAFSYYFFFIFLAWPIPAAILASVAVCAFAGFLFNKLVFQKLKKESMWTLLIASIGVSLFVKSTMLLVATGKGRNFAREGYEVNTYSFYEGAITITDYQIIILLSTVAIMAGLWLFLKYSKLGKAIRAVSDNPEVAAILGINVKSTVNKIFIISSCLAGFAGILIGYEQNISPNMGLALSIVAFAAVIVGGLGSIWGSVAGAMLIGILQNVLLGINIGDFEIPTSYKSAIAFSVLIITLLIRPRGLFGTSVEEESGKK